MSSRNQFFVLMYRKISLKSVSHTSKTTQNMTDESSNRKLAKRRTEEPNSERPMLTLHSSGESLRLLRPHKFAGEREREREKEKERGRKEEGEGEEGEREMSVLCSLIEEGEGEKGEREMSVLCSLIARRSLKRLFGPQKSSSLPTPHVFDL